MSESVRHPTGCIDPVLGGLLEDYLENRLDQPREDAFEDHFFRCSACLAELRLRQALPAALAGTKMRQQRPAGSVVALGSVAALLLAFTGYLVVVELPRSRERAARLASELDAARADLDQLNSAHNPDEWSGAVSFAFLTGPDRDGETPKVMVVIQKGQPSVPLAATPVLPAGAKADDRFELQIRDGAGKKEWSLEMSSSEISSAMAAAKFVSFLVPARSLSEGRHSLVLLDLARHSADPVWRSSFQVVTRAR
jgi:hypothetical protein